MDVINSTGKPRVYIGNIMTQPGETVGYKLSDHIRALRAHVGDDFPDVVIAHNGAVPENVAETYRRQGAEPVVQDLDDLEEFQSVRVVTDNFFADEKEYSSASSARHDSARLARVIYDSFLRSPRRGASKGAGRVVTSTGPDSSACQP